MLTRRLHRRGLALHSAGSVCMVLGALVTESIAAGPQLPKGDLAPPIRVRWAEPGEPLPDELKVPDPTPPLKKEIPKVIEDPEPRVVGNGYGSMGRASYLGGKTFGRNDSITPLEVLPYLLTDEHFIFADIRGFVTNRSEGGGNFGIGYRRLIDDWNAWGGASVWYDADQSTGKMFQQIGLSFEGLINQIELRSNIYLPITSSQTFGNTITQSSIVGNQLLYTRTMDVGSSMRGVDFEGGYSLPVLDRYLVRGFIGGYHFEGGGSSSVNGFKARAEAVFNNAVTGQILYTTDPLYGSNVMLGISMQLPFGKNHPASGWIRSTPSPFRFVERLYNVVVDRSPENMMNQVAADPTTGHAYTVDQVYSPSGPTLINAGADGTTANPFSSIAAAQGAGGNVILVQNGSVISEAVVLSPGQHLFGLGNSTSSLATTGGGYVPIPNLMQAGLLAGDRPVIQNVTGTAVTLQSNTEIAGFRIEGSTGNGVAGNGIAGVSIHDIIFDSIGGDAIHLSDSSGSVFVGNTQINSSVGNGIVIQGANPNIVFAGMGSSITSQGNGFVLQDLSGGSVVVSDLSIMNAGGTGLLMDRVGVDSTFRSLSITGSGGGPSGGAAVSILGPSGAATTDTFYGTTRISSPSGAGFSVSDSNARINLADLNVTSSANAPAISLVNATGSVGIGNVTVNTENATGLLANNSSDVQIGGGSFTTVNASAIDVNSSKFNAKLGSVSVDGGDYGVRIIGSTGNLSIVGSGGSGSGGTIQNTTTAGLLINSYGTTNLGWINFHNNGVAIQSSGTTGMLMGNMQITDSKSYAIDSLNDLTFSLVSSTFSGNGAVGGGTIREQATAVGSYTSTYSGNSITDPHGMAIQTLTGPAASGATLSLQMNSNSVNGYGNGSSIIRIDWTGPVTANITSNRIHAFGTQMTGISLQDSSTKDLLTATFASNEVDFQPAATSGTGISIVDGQSGQSFTSSSNLTLTGNVVDFQGTNGTGLRFGLYRTNTTTVTSNRVSDHVGGLTGVLFDYASSGSTLTFTGNQIGLLSGDTLDRHGFVFSQGAPTVLLNYQQQSATNWVYNTPSGATSFSMQPGIGTGGILINNNYFAAPQ